MIACDMSFRERQPLPLPAYRDGYSLEALRDLELVRLTTDESRHGYPRELGTSTPRAENTGADTVPGTDGAEVEEVSVRLLLTGIAHTIRM
jgi:hypothetical protein